MRHRDDRLNGTEEIPAYVDAITEILKPRSWPPCFVLLASDRRASLPAFEARLRESHVSCVLVTSKRAAEETDHSKQSDHGSDAGVVALRDVFLLSHSSVLLAGFGGTFGALIGELMAHRFVERHSIASTTRLSRTVLSAAKPRPPAIRFCDQPAFSGKCAPELPLVSQSWWHSRVVLSRERQWHFSRAWRPRPPPRPNVCANRFERPQAGATQVWGVGQQLSMPRCTSPDDSRCEGRDFDAGQPDGGRARRQV